MCKDNISDNIGGNKQVIETEVREYGNFLHYLCNFPVSLKSFQNEEFGLLNVTFLLSQLNVYI